jgi:WhiB family transcriptional regulator, redox-sensing transcriptional regulator
MNFAATTTPLSDGHLADELESLLQPPWWHQYAACRDSGTEVFFDKAKDVELALSICSRCAVEDMCRAVALEDPELQGVWGGTTAPERRRLRKASASLTG